MRFYAKWPAFIDIQLLQLEYAITMKPVSDLAMDYGKTKFELANQTLSDEGLKNSGVTDPQLFKTLGVFGIVLIFLLICVGFYFLLRWLIKVIKAEKYPKLNNLADKLRDKLFYSAFLRYMIVSNLKLTYT